MAMNPGSAMVLPSFRPETPEIQESEDLEGSEQATPPPLSQNSALNSE
ncbi:hypothetical protein TrLO_g11411, partial [Triparma laevis f. longispina]